jgi:TolB-like protein/tRNA A-37 threonylcarbamoyl transferase component Bud32/Flp pilus assembly protein TadD
MSLQPGAMLQHYRLLERIGEGGMGVVWKALDTVLLRNVAVKVLPDALAGDEALLERLQGEARALAALNHPGIVTLHSIEHDGGCRFLTMELVEGRGLGEMIPAGGMAPAEFVAVALPLADAVAAAHRRGVTHRDIKPANVMVTPEGRVKVLDFGLACSGAPLESGTADAPTRTRAANVLAGTLAYMSPEQVQGFEVDARTDLFSLGVVLYEMATGRHPFAASSTAGAISALLRDPPVPPTRLNSDYPPRLDRLLASCLEKDPARRMRSADDLLWELEQLRVEAAGERGRPLSIAVLPLADASQEKDQEYFCEGVAEEIIVALSKVGGLRVASRAATFGCQQGEADIGTIARRLGVATVLSGAARRSGERLRVTVELVDAADGFEIWAERYDGSVRDVFAIQDQITEGVVKALQVRLSDREREVLRRRSTSDVAAYDYYLRARKYFYQYSRRSMQAALSLFSRAIEQDAGYARAFAGIADCCSFLYQNAGAQPGDLERADSASARAVALDADLAEGHASRGVAQSLAGRHSEAEKEFARASDLDPRLFEAHYFRARDLFGQGRLEEAAAEYAAASAVRPEDYQSPLLVAQIYDDLGKRAEAVVARRSGVEAAEEHLRLNPEDARALYMGANGLVALGERQRGLEWADRALALEGEDPMVLYNIACIKALAGATEDALDCLERSVRAGMRYRGWLEHDSNLDSLRSSPRFEAVMDALS